MLPYLLTVLVMWPGTYAHVFLSAKLGEAPRPHRVAVAGSVIGHIIWGINHICLAAPSAILENVTNLAVAILVFFCSSEAFRLWGVISYVVYVVCQLGVVFVMALVAVPVGGAMGLSLLELSDKAGYANSVMTLICTVLSIPLMALLYKPLLRFRHRYPVSRWTPLLLAVPGSQILLISVIMNLGVESAVFSGISPTLLVGILLCIAADLAFFLSIRKLREAQRLESHMRMIEQQLDNQAEYYRQMQENIQSINSIRHDLNNQLQAAYYLLEKGETAMVRRQLDALSESLRGKVGPSYCANLMVDAVLTEKARLCREKGIRLDVSVSLPAELSIESSHLCSVFSNLLDNAIQGVTEYPGEDRYIELRSSLHTEYLTVHCLNPSKPVHKKRSREPLRRHGLGLDILEHLAKRYDGTFQTDFQDGCFHATLILQFPEVSA